MDGVIKFIETAVWIAGLMGACAVAILWWQRREAVRRRRALDALIDRETRNPSFGYLANVRDKPPGWGEALSELEGPKPQ